MLKLRRPNSYCNAIADGEKSVPRHSWSREHLPLAKLVLNAGIAEHCCATRSNTEQEWFEREGNRTAKKQDFAMAVLDVSCAGNARLCSESR
jgi:hypothetical protein